MKICETCGKIKDLEEFSIDRRSKDGRLYRCKTCDSEAHHRNYLARHEYFLAQAAAYRKANREQVRAANRKYAAENPEPPEKIRVRQVKRRYGITEAALNALLAKQGGKCAICGSLGGGTGVFPLDIDHDHQTNKVRGLLCFKCNTGLGCFMDSPGCLRAAANYLDKANPLK